MARTAAFRNLARIMRIARRACYRLPLLVQLYRLQARNALRSPVGYPISCTVGALPAPITPAAPAPPTGSATARGVAAVSAFGFGRAGRRGSLLALGGFALDRVMVRRRCARYG